jgi:hypothetical protein
MWYYSKLMVAIKKRGVFYMSKSGKTIAMLLAMTFMVACAGPSLQMARAYDGVVVQGAGPTEPGTESILAHDTVWRYGVQQVTTLGVAVNVAENLLSISGAAKCPENVKATIAKTLGLSFIEKVLPTSRTVNIRFDRYILRGADGKRYYKVYASYYQLDGSLITSALVLEGLDR